MSNIFDVSDDILSDIISRLPAKSFAAAACVNPLWNRVCGLILSRPRFVSAMSLAKYPEIAVDETLEVALSKPIRPHFVIAFVGLSFTVEEIHNLIRSKIGANTTLITTATLGPIGVKSETNHATWNKWGWNEGGWNEDPPITFGTIYRGITLVIGFLPGLKIRVVPLLHTNSETQVAMIDKFISDVRDFTISVSGDTNPDPDGIMLFGDRRRNLKPILAEIDAKISRETVMIGSAHTYFVCTDAAISNLDTSLYTLDAVALVFARDNQDSEVEIKFHMGISRGIIPFGPKIEILYKLEYEGKSSLLARTEGDLMPLDAFDLLLSLDPLTKDESYRLYIGVKKEIVPQDGGTTIKYTDFHEVVGRQQNMFVVAGTRIHPGDSCMFYHSDVYTAGISTENVFKDFKSILKPSTPYQALKEKVFGGFLFTSSNRWEDFFGFGLMDLLPFSMNFPKVPLGGMICYEPVGRSSVSEEELGQSDEERFNMQVFNAVHLVMSYKTS